MSRKAIAILSCCLLACASGAFDTTTGAVRAQNGSGRLSEQSPEFEVASVKRNNLLGGERGAGFQPGGRFSAKNMTLRGLIAAAYGTPQPLPLYRVVGGPGWIDSDRFDIEARASTDLSDLPGKPGWSPRGQEMLRTLLASRFRLVAYQETRELPSYALVTVRSDGRLGSQIVASQHEECERVSPTVTITALRWVSIYTARARQWTSPDDGRDRPIHHVERRRSASVEQDRTERPFQYRS